MWISEAQYEIFEEIDAEQLERTTRMLALMASEMDGFKETRLYVSDDRTALTCISFWDGREPAAMFVQHVLEQGSATLERSYKARMVSARLMERIAAFTADDLMGVSTADLY
ncbi:MAG: hypothetical protein ACJ762_10220 [Solirubrobacteraceae bacterium]